MARITKRTDERVERILEALSSGQTRRIAAACGGVSDDTLRRWIQTDSELSLRVSAAESQAQIALVACIRNAADHDWRAAAWLLERRDPANWSLRQQLAVHATTQEPMKVIVEYVDQATPAAHLTDQRP
jgi:hypothetical protein